MRRFVLLLSLLLPGIRIAQALDAGDALEQFGRQTWRTENGLPQNTVRAIAQTRDGYLWFGTDGGLVRFDGFRFTVYDVQSSPALVTNQIRRLSGRADGSLWIATSGGNAYLDAGGIHPASEAPPSPPSTLTDREGSTWIGSDSGGLVRVRNGVPEKFSPSDPLSEDIILSLFEDQQGDLWIGTDSSGVTVLREQKFASYTGRAYGIEKARCVLADHNGNLWVGTDGYGLVRMVNGIPEPAPFNLRLSSQIVLSLAETTSGDLLVGTPDGLDRVHGRTVTVMTSADGLPEDFIRSLLADDNGSYWVGTRRGLSHVEGTTVTTYTQANGLGSDMVGALARDRNGDLWVGTLHGLSRFRQGRFTNFTVEDGLSSNVITDLFVDHSARLWIATQGGGLDYARGQRFARLMAEGSLPENVSGVTEDRGGSLWLATFNGIVRVDALEAERVGSNGHGRIHPIVYGTSDGLRVAECGEGGHPAITRTKSGDIWFAMSRGLAVLKAIHALLDTHAPPVVLQSVSLDEHSFPPSEVQTVAAGYSHLSLEYAGLEFRAPAKVRYRYQLAGFDRNWIDAGTRRIAYYTNLPPHDYDFRVVACNGDGVWNETGLSFRFRVEPHAYQTWWFRSLLVLLLGLLVYAAYYLRLRQVEAQYNAVLLERNRIAREIHDTLAQGFIGVSVQLELVARLLGTSVDAAREQLNETRLLVRRSIADARQSIWELRSQSPEQQDFAVKLNNMAKQAAASSSARVEMRVQGTYRPLGTKVEDELFRIGQEAVANAIRHSGATTIAIQLAFDTKGLRMTVADDGCGFSGTVHSTGPEGHFGLKGMRERAQQIQADLRVESEAGKGTTVTVETPAK